MQLWCIGLVCCPIRLESMSNSPRGYIGPKVVGVPPLSAVYSDILLRLEELEPKGAAAAIPQSQLDHVSCSKVGHRSKKLCVLVHERLYLVEDEALVSQIPVISK